jgi:molybdate transport system ATP-binding protein
LSSILNVLPARIVSATPVEADEIIAVLALGADGSGARLLSRLTRKSWDSLSLAEGTSVYAQVKAVALAPGRGELG